MFEVQTPTGRLRDTEGIKTFSSEHLARLFVRLTFGIVESETWEVVQVSEHPTKFTPNNG
jgi:hypothetical protein